MRYRGVAIVVVLSGLAFATSGQSGGDYELRKSTIDSGGQRSEGGARVVTGTIGQHDASAATAVGGRFRVRGGFWAQSDPVDLFKDGFEEPSP
jgi:hypothetical protein